MLGAIIGDIVGSRFEFSNTDDKDFELFSPDCDFTDDTICTVAIADAIIKGESYKDSLVKWCRKYPNPMGEYGSSFARWIYNPVPYFSYGNGSAMRVSPIGWLFDNDVDVLAEAEKSAAVSHNHPEGIKGAMAIAFAVYILRKYHSKDSISVIEEMLYKNTLLPKRYEFDVTCQGCVPLALHLFKQSTSFEDAIRKAVLYGGDTDTVAAITGSLAEAYYGIPYSFEEKARSYLPQEMNKVIDMFNLNFKENGR